MDDAKAAAAAGATLCHGRINGIQMEWADTGGPAGESLPIVLFMHGFPEGWFSWRHQLAAVKAVGLRGIAPSMRGYGATEAPADTESYNVYTLAADMLGLLQHLGASHVALVGHDHGASLGWKLALLHPHIFTVYVAMSVPYSGRPLGAPLAGLRTVFGDERADDSNFFYMLHHCLPIAPAQYGGANTTAALRALYYFGTGPQAAEASAPAPAPVSSQKLRVDGVPEPLWRRVPQPKALPSWISEAEFEYFVRCFERSGWHGGLKWYAVMDLDWHATPHLASRKLSQPIAFISGASDGVIRMSGGRKKVEEGIRAVCEQPPEVHFLPGVGHWLQQEVPAEVSRLLLAFLAKHRDRFAGAAMPRSKL